MKIGFVFTNYNNSLLSVQAAQSIATHHGDCDYQILLVDNASNEPERSILAAPGALPPHCEVVWNADNIGYFGGLNLGLAALRTEASDYDVIVIGNNDLVFDADFFAALQRRSDVLARYPVVAPNIITLDSQHQNPHVLVGISRFREVVWDLYYANFRLSQFIGWAANRARAFAGRKDYLAHADEGTIYEGYGACYILTPCFWLHHAQLWSPGFLMGEEFYLTRQLAAKNEQIYYVPDIRVHHHDHATIAKLPSRRLWEMTRQYHRIYRFFINPYRIVMDNGKTPADYELSVGEKARSTPI